MHFDLVDLRVFLRTCTEGSMTAAAHRLHLTLAAVSARIRSLERNLGVELLSRHARGVAPTAAGRVLAAHAQTVLQELDAIQRAFAAPRANDAGLLLLANSSAIARPLGSFLADVLLGHPTLRVEVRESPSDVTVNALRAGMADLGIISDAADTAGLETDVLGPDPLMVVMGAGHPWRTRDSIRFEDLLEHELVIWGAGTALHVHLALHGLRAGRALRERAVVHSAQDAIELAAAGIGLAVLPAGLTCGTAVESGACARPLDAPWARRRMLLCRRAGGSYLRSMP
jgi:DNA-binding transcriptional LysR family regulator